MVTASDGLLAGPDASEGDFDDAADTFVRVGSMPGRVTSSGFDDRLGRGVTAELSPVETATPSRARAAPSCSPANFAYLPGSNNEPIGKSLTQRQLL